MILICKLRDICSIEHQKDKISLKSHVSDWQPLKSPAPENRLYFIDHKSTQCVLSFYYLGSKILWDGKFLSFPVCKYTIFNGLVLYLKTVLSGVLARPSHCISKYSGHVFWPLLPELGAGQKAGTWGSNNLRGNFQSARSSGDHPGPKGLTTQPIKASCTVRWWGTLKHFSLEYVWLLLQNKKDLRMGQPQNRFFQRSLQNLSRIVVTQGKPGTWFQKKGNSNTPVFTHQLVWSVHWTVGAGIRPSCSAHEDLNPWCLALFRGRKLSLSGYYIFLGWGEGRKPTSNFSFWSHSFYIGLLHINWPEDKHYSLDAPLGKGTPVFQSCLLLLREQQWSGDRKAGLPSPALSRSGECPAAGTMLLLFGWRNKQLHNTASNSCKGRTEESPSLWYPIACCWSTYPCNWVRGQKGEGDPALLTFGDAGRAQGEVQILYKSKIDASAGSTAAGVPWSPGQLELFWELFPSPQINVPLTKERGIWGTEIRNSGI